MATAKGAFSLRSAAFWSRTKDLKVDHRYMYLIIHHSFACRHHMLDTQLAVCVVLVGKGPGKA